MHLTVERLADTVHKLKQLRMLLDRSVDDEDYSHEAWLHPCGSPSCALGWATTIWTEAFAIERDYSRAGDGIWSIALRSSEVDPEEYAALLKYTDETPDRWELHGAEAAAEFFGMSERLAHYIFGYAVPDYPNLGRHLDNHSKATTVERINRVEGYLRRKLAILIVEREAPEYSHIEASNPFSDYLETNVLEEIA